MEEILNIPTIADETNFWFVRAGKRARYFTDFQVNNYIGVNTYKAPKQKIPEGVVPNQNEITLVYKKTIYELLLKQKSAEFKKKYPSLEDKDILDKAIQSAKRSAGKKAATLFRFRHQMKPTDFVITPGVRSNQYLIGILLSEPEFQISHKHPLNEDGAMLNYDESPYVEGKSIHWIKLVDYQDLPDTTKSFKQSNGAIFDISDKINDLLPLLFPLYIYKQQLYTRLNVSSTETHTSSQFYKLQGVFEKTRTDSSVDYIQKTKVTSPGYIILSTVSENLPSICNLLKTLGIEIGIGLGTGGVLFPTLKYLGPTINSYLKSGAKIDKKLKQQKYNQGEAEEKRKEAEEKRKEEKFKLDQQKEKEEIRSLKLDNDQKEQTLKSNNSSQKNNNIVQLTKEQINENFNNVNDGTKKEGKDIAKELGINLNLPGKDISNK